MVFTEVIRDHFLKKKHVCIKIEFSSQTLVHPHQIFLPTQLCVMCKPRKNGKNVRHICRCHFCLSCKLKPRIRNIVAKLSLLLRCTSAMQPWLTLSCKFLGVPGKNGIQKGGLFLAAFLSNTPNYWVYPQARLTLDAIYCIISSSSFSLCDDCSFPANCGPLIRGLP